MGLSSTSLFFVMPYTIGTDGISKISVSYICVGSSSCLGLSKGEFLPCIIMRSMTFFRDEVCHDDKIKPTTPQPLNKFARLLFHYKENFFDVCVC